MSSLRFFMASSGSSNAVVVSPRKGGRPSPGADDDVDAVVLVVGGRSTAKSATEGAEVMLRLFLYLALKTERIVHLFTDFFRQLVQDGFCIISAFLIVPDDLTAYNVELLLQVLRRTIFQICNQSKFGAHPIFHGSFSRR